VSLPLQSPGRTTLLWRSTTKSVVLLSSSCLTDAHVALQPAVSLGHTWTVHCIHTLEGNHLRSAIAFSTNNALAESLILVVGEYHLCATPSASERQQLSCHLQPQDVHTKAHVCNVATLVLWQHALQCDLAVPDSWLKCACNCMATLTQLPAATNTIKQRQLCNRRSTYTHIYMQYHCT
jgi:hypothetical protein